MRAYISRGGVHPKRYIQDYFDDMVREVQKALPVINELGQLRSLIAARFGNKNLCIELNDRVMNVAFGNWLVMQVKEYKNPN